MDPLVFEEMTSGLKTSRLLPFPFPHEATIANRPQKDGGWYILYSGGLGMSYYWEIRFRNGEYAWADIDACGGYEVISYTTPSWSHMASYANRILEPHLRRYRRRIQQRQSRETPSEVEQSK